MLCISYVYMFTKNLIVKDWVDVILYDNLRVTITNKNLLVILWVVKKFWESSDMS